MQPHIVLVRPVFLSKIFLYTTDDFKKIVILRTITNEWRDAIDYYAPNLWRNAVDSIKHKNKFHIIHFICRSKHFVDMLQRYIEFGKLDVNAKFEFNNDILTLLSIACL